MRSTSTREIEMDIVHPLTLQLFRQGPTHLRIAI